jgi:hypothetical protein
VGKQITEMLKGTLEGVVLAILSDRSAYGYEITAWLRKQGFSDIAEGTVYALLSEGRTEAASSTWRRSRRRRGRRARCTRSTTRAGITSTSSGGLGVSSRTTRTAPRRRQMTMSDEEERGLIAEGDRVVRREGGGSTKRTALRRRSPSNVRARRSMAFERYLMYYVPVRQRRARPSHDGRAILPTCGSARKSMGPRCARSSARTRSSSSRRSWQNYTKATGMSRQGASRLDQGYRDRAIEGTPPT